MGLFDKMKSKVASIAGQATQQPQPQYQAPPEEPAYEEPEQEDQEDADDWGGWDPNDWQGYWYRLKAMELAGNQGGDDACDAKAREFGLRDWSHMQRVRDTFTKHFGDRHEFIQAAMQANTQATRDPNGGDRCRSGDGRPAARREAPGRFHRRPRRSDRDPAEGGRPSLADDRPGRLTQSEDHVHRRCS